MTRDQNRKYLRCGIHFLNTMIGGFILSWMGFAEYLNHEWQKTTFVLIFGVSLFGSFIFFLVLGIGPRYLEFLKKRDLLTPKEVKIFDILTIED